jgi:hypothetical protein
MVGCMGFFAERKKKAQLKVAQAAATKSAAALAEWQKNSAALEVMLKVVDDCRHGKIHEQFVDTNDYGFMLKSGEFPIAYLQGVAYLENVKAPTQYSGGYGGVSFPIFGRVRLNTGRTGGKITQGAESINRTDDGHALVTNTRIMFAGSKRAHEWRFDKMMGCSHLPGGITIFAMTTGGKPAGLGYGDGPASEVQFRIELASAIALGTLERYEQELVAEQVQHASELPIASSPP